MSRKILFAEGEYYHLYNRGVDKRIVFENENDYKRCMLLFYLCNGKTPIRFEDIPNWKRATPAELMALFAEIIDPPIVAIGAYCLMPNHFHLLVREISEKGVSTFMHRFSTAYTMYFNESRKRTGALFQGRFKAEHAGNDAYLKYLFSYIHLNPVKLIDPTWKEKGITDRKRAERFLDDYPYSSLPDYASPKRAFSKIVNRKAFPEYFAKKRDVAAHIADWLWYSKEFGNEGKAQPYLR